MTVRALIERLEKLAEQLGDNSPVLVVDGEGEWGFSVHVESQFLQEAAPWVVYLDITGEPE